MPRNFPILVFMFLMFASYGQKSTLLQNINFRAKELKHGLNKNGDSLILSSEKTIYSVDIFNQDFEKTIEVKANKTKIPLNGTPLGRLVVQAKMSDKLIIMTLLRHEEIDKGIDKKHELKIRPHVTHISNLKSPNSFNNKTVATNATLIVSTQFDTRVKIKTQQKDSEFLVEENAERKQHISKPPKTSLTNMLNWRPKSTTKSQKFYWIEEEVINGSSSRKSMRLVNESIALRMISKNKLERRTHQGKHNLLTIWEIYDTDKFMKEQVENPDYINSSSSELFNVEPYFKTSNFRTNPTTP